MDFLVRQRTMKLYIFSTFCHSRATALLPNSMWDSHCHKLTPFKSLHQKFTPHKTVMQADSMSLF